MTIVGVQNYGQIINWYTSGAGRRPMIV